MAARLAAAIRSRRSIVVTMFGTMYALVGGAQLGTADQIKASPIAARSYRAHLELMPLDVWAWLFIGCGLVAVAAGLTMWHTIGFASLMGISAWWGLEFIASWWSTGYDRAVIGALTWLLLAGLLAVVSGWPDSAPPHRAALDAFLESPQ